MRSKRPTRAPMASPPIGLAVALLVLALPQGFAQAAPPSGDEIARQKYLSANGLLNRGLHEMAATEYEEFLSAHPRHEKTPLARYGLGVARYRLSQFGEASKALTPLLREEDFEFSAEAMVLLGQSELARREYAAAAEVLTAAQKAHPAHDLADEAAVGAIEALYSLSKYDETAAWARTFASRYEDSPLRDRAEFFAGLAEMKRSSFAAAAEHFGWIVGNAKGGAFADQAGLLLAQSRQRGGSIDEAIARYRAVLSRADTQFASDARLAMGSLLLGKGDPRGAARALDALIESDAKHPQIATAHLLRGRAAFDLGEYSEAEVALDRVAKATESDELRGEAAYWIGKSKLRAGDAAGAAKALAGAIEKHGDHRLLPEMCYDLGVALVRQRKYDDASLVLKAMISKSEDHPLVADATYLLAIAEQQRGNYEDSLRFASRVGEEHTGRTQAAGAAFLAAENLYLLERYDEAIESFSAFLSRHEDAAQADQARFRLGSAQHRVGKLEEARPVLEAVVKQGGDSFASAKYALGDLHFQRSEWKTAAMWMKKYLAGGDEVSLADDAMLKLALSQQRAGETDEAIETFTKLIDRFPKSPHRLQAIFERGQSFVTAGRNEEAGRDFNVVVAQGEDSRFAPYALNHLASLSMKRGDFDATASLYEKTGAAGGDEALASGALFHKAQALMAARKFEEAEDALSSFLSRYPSDDRAETARGQRAVALSRLDRCEDAVRDAGRAIESKKLSAMIEPVVMYEKGWCERKLGTTAAAQRTFESLAGDHPTSQEAMHGLLELAAIAMAAEIKDYERAAGYLVELRTRASSGEASSDLFARATYSLGVCRFELGSLSESAELFEEFIATNPKALLLASASFYAGESHYRNGRFDSAVPHYERVVEQHASAPSAPAAMLRLGESLAQLNRWSRCEEVFGDYLAKHADSEHWYQAQFGIGWAREHLGRRNDAIEAYSKVVANHQGSTAARAQFQIGECLFAEGEYDKAARELLRVDILYSYPEWSAAGLYEAGRCFEKLGKPVEARKQYEDLVTRFADSKWAKMATDRLASTATKKVPGQ